MSDNHSSLSSRSCLILVIMRWILFAIAFFVAFVAVWLRDLSKVLKPYLVLPLKKRFEWLIDLGCSDLLLEISV